MDYIAHIFDRNIQTCTEHCRNTAKYSGDNLKDIGLIQTAYLAGLLHDCGKFTSKFEEYIRASCAGLPVKRGSVIHSFAGVRCMLNRFHSGNTEDAEKYFRVLTSEIISGAVGCHHGLFDFSAIDGKNGFTYRIEKQPEYDDDAISNFLMSCCGEDELSERFNKSVDEVKSILYKFGELTQEPDEFKYYEGMLARLVSSAVIDGDRRDTAEFMQGISPDKDGLSSSELKGIWSSFADKLMSRLNRYLCDTVIQIARREISDKCAEFASNKSGIYRLNVPTGGAKTLASIRYAIEHSINHGKARIFYIAPLISIIEQNAKAIREAVGKEYVLEHHSNVIREEESDGKNDTERSVDEIARGALEESWDAPIIVTTLVQFLNTLFSDSTGCVRRMNKLTNSVIILDEVQTVPVRMLTLFNLAINFLAKICGASVLLCSATQPCFENVKHNMIVSEGRILQTEDEARLRRIFKRNDYIDAGDKAFAELPEFIAGKAEKYASLLVICNKKAEAVGLWAQLKDMGYCCLVLTSAMCMAHRRNVLAKIDNKLKNRDRIICISTQVIEAGVDISFEAAIRLTAGLDNIIQTAGRCNRSGEFGKASPVFIVNCKDERLTSLRDIQSAKSASLNLLNEYRKAPERFDNSLSSDLSIRKYYEFLYSSESGKVDRMDYPVKNYPTLYSMLTDFPQYYSKSAYDSRYILHQALKTAGSLFSALDSRTTSVLVPYGEGENIIAELCRGDCLSDIAKAKAVIGRAKAYTVSLFDYELKKLNEQGAVMVLCGGLIAALKKEYYDSNRGVITHISDVKEEEDCILIL